MNPTVLHIGLMKSGTSFLQQQLFANQALLRERGVVVPGETWDDQRWAVTDVLGRPSPGLKPNQGSWQRLLDELRAADGRGVVSMEFLGPVGPEAIQRIARDLPDARIVITVRDLNRTIVALWQETIQNGRDWTFDDYRADLRRSRPGHELGPKAEAGHTFWRQQDAVRIARAWRASYDEVAVVSVPPPGAPRTLLMARFAEACGFDPRGLVQTRLVEGQTGNESLGAASILALRRMNELLNAQGMAFPQGTQVRKRQLAKRILASHRAEEEAIGLAVEAWVREHADELVRGLQGLGVSLVGDWADLAPVDVPGIDPAAVPADDVAEAAVVGLTGLVADRIRAKNRDNQARKGPVTS